MKIELDKAYESKKFEDQIYKTWEESGFFNPNNLENTGEAYCITMPPPNVTGILHLGHALENSLLDTEIRYQRMLGKKALLIPGADHAAVATQARVEKELQKAGIKNPREELGREKLLEEIKKYAENSKSTILNQIRKMGTSCDWSRFSYTFDDKRSLAVNTLFKKMYDDGLIYRGSRLINWDPKLQTTISDDEIIYEEEKVPFYYLQYGPFVIATARPETKFGDKYVVMHPDDERYANYKHGDTFECEWINGKVTATVIKDEVIDMNFGTGVMTITPWHDATDFELAQKHKLEMEQIIDLHGNLMPIAGEFSGMNIIEAREKIAERLKEKGLLVKVEEDYLHKVAKGDRSGAVIEPQISKQWFIDVNKEIPGKEKSLKQLMKDVFTIGHNGDKNKIINITPDRFLNSYMQWIDNLRDWCISRQIWWGHRIPVCYCDDCQNVFYGENKIDCPKCNSKNTRQDEDTLDTWFSSGSWTFSTLGWPEETRDLKTYHPTSWMQMGYELLFFWMARMILMSTYTLDNIPFKNVYIHGILRAKDGKKFSKSLGNGLDPIEIINEFGTDALRLSLLKGTAPGNDARFYEEKVLGSRNFVNKLWNISRYILMSCENVEYSENIKATTLSDKWILSKFSKLVESVSNNLDNHNFSNACEELYEFTWDDFADWYLEVSKIEKDKENILIYILENLLKLWHPTIPFVTEAIWSNLGKEKMLMVESWPRPNIEIDSISEESFETIKEIIGSIRNLKNENKIDLKTVINCNIKSDKFNSLIKDQSLIIENLARVKLTDEIYKDTIHLPNIEIYIEIKVSEEDVKKKKDELQKYISSLETKLSNAQFVERAPKEVIDGEKKKLEEAKELLLKLK